MECYRMIKILTDNIQISHLTFHWIRIHLAHVPSSIRFPNILDFQYPRFVLRMHDTHPLIFRDDMIFYRKNGLRVNT